jgi:hypothetical protein
MSRSIHGEGPERALPDARRGRQLAVGGTVMAGQSDLDPDRNSVQPLVAAKRDDVWRLAASQNVRVSKLPLEAILVGVFPHGCEARVQRQGSDMVMNKRLISWILVGSFAISTFSLASGAAVASVRGRKTTAIILGGATAYSILKKKPSQSLILGAATYYAYRNYRRARERQIARRAFAAGYRTALRAASSRRRAYWRTAGYRSTYRRRHRRRFRSRPYRCQAAYSSTHRW